MGSICRIPAPGAPHPCRRSARVGSSPIRSPGSRPHWPTVLEQRVSWCELAVGLIIFCCTPSPRPPARTSLHLSHSLPPCRPPTSARPFPPFSPFLSQFWTDLQPSLWDPRESIICCIARIQATLFPIAAPPPSTASAIIRPERTHVAQRLMYSPCFTASPTALGN